MVPRAIVTRHRRCVAAITGFLLVVILATSCSDKGDDGHAHRETGPAADRIAAASVAWVQHSEDGLQLRIVATANRCPQVVLNGVPMEPAERELTDPAFPAASCTIPVVPGDSVDFGQRHFDVAGSTERIVVIADPACDVLDCELDSFSRLASAAAATDPSLVVVAGNLVADSQVCFTQPGCRPPTGDRWATWKLRFFDPGKPLLEAAPIVFARGSVHACDGDKFEGWGHLVSPGWYPASVMCRPVDPSVQVDLDEQVTLTAVDATSVPPSLETPSWLVTGALPNGADLDGFRARLWIRPAESPSYSRDRGDGVAELLAGPATGPQASFWLIEHGEQCWQGERYTADGPTGERTECLPQ